MAAPKEKALIEDHYRKLEEQYGIEFLTPGECKEALRDYVRTADLADPDTQHFCFMGEPGCGKSAIPKAVCQEEGINLLIIRASNIDEGVLGGYPGTVADMPGVVDLHFVRYYKEKLEAFIADGDKKIMIFFDELNRAKDHIIQSTFNIIDRKIIANFELPAERTMFVVSINPATDAHSVRDIIGREAALNRRFEVYGMKADAKSFLDYADTVPDFHPLVKEYIRNNPDNIMGLTHMNAGKKYACPAIYKSFSRQLTAMEKSGINLLRLKKHPVKIRRLNAMFGTGEGQALLNFIVDSSRHVTPTLVLQDYDRVQPLIKAERALVLNPRVLDPDGNEVQPIDDEIKTESGDDGLDYGQLTKLATEVATYVARFKPDLKSNKTWARNLARFMEDLPDSPLRLFFDKLHSDMQSSDYSTDLVAALIGVEEFQRASHRAHTVKKEAMKAFENAAKQG